MNQHTRIAVVTGANRGLGMESCRQLARHRIKVILTARDANKGKKAAEALRKEHLDVMFHPLDVTDSSSIEQFAHMLEKDYGGVDILVNNAGIFIDPKDESSVFKADIDTLRTTMETNVYGPIRLCQQLILLMKGNGRVVNVSSGMGQLSDMNGGYPGYRLSKTSLNALTRILADELKDTQIKVNSLCPGWVRTDMGGPNADRSVEQGVETIVWLATLPDDGPSGGFFRDKQPIPW